MSRRVGPPNERGFSRLQLDPGLCTGKTCIRGLRYTAEAILELLSSGMTTDEILLDYPDLEREDIRATLAYATRVRRAGQD